MDNLIRSLLKRRSYYFKFLGFRTHKYSDAVPTALLNLPAADDSIENDLRGALSSRSMMIALEPRIVFDAAAVATVEAVDQTAQTDAQAQTNNDQDGSNDNQDQTNSDNTDGDSDSDSSDSDYHSIIIPPDLRSGHEIVFVDSGISNYETLLQGMNPEAIVVVLDAQHDGIQQISDVLAQLENVPAVHIISHGTDGQISLGSTHLGSDNLANYSEQLAQWANSLTQNADILLYGCDVADDAQGTQFVQQLADITGADIAASDDLTGAAALEGDWDLEVHTGSIESMVVVSQYAQDNFDGVLEASVIAVPGGPSTNEDTPVTLSTLFNLEDTEGGADNQTVTLTISTDYLVSGNFSDDGTIGGIGGGVTAGYTESVGYVISGIYNDVVAALDHLYWTPGQDQNGTVQFFAMLLDDMYLTESNSSNALQVVAVDDAPVHTIQDNTVSTNEDTSYTFNNANGSLISVADVDNTHARVTLSVGNGALTLSQTTGLTFVAGDGTSDGTMTFYGTTANVNAALNGLVYAPSPETNGPDTLTVTTYGSNDGSQAGVADTDNITITVNPVNDAPVLDGVPSNTTMNEDATLGIDLSDLVITDGDSDDMTITLSVANGVINFGPGDGGVSTVTMNGSGTDTITITGDKDSINNFFSSEGGSNNFQYAPDADWNGTETFNISADDGDGGSSTDSDSFNITVNAVPINSVPGAQSTNEDTALTFNAGNSNLISVTDIGTGFARVTLAGTNGTITLSQTTGLTFTAGDGTSDGTMTFWGSTANVNAALNGLSFTPSSNYNGAGGQISITTYEANGSGTAQGNADTDTVAITVNAVNDAPTINFTIPDASTNEDESVAIDLTNLSFSDIDGDGQIVVSLDVTDGVWTYSGGDITSYGFSVATGFMTSESGITIQGDIAAISSFFGSEGANFSFTPTANFHGTAAATLTVNDVDAGGSPSSTDLFNIFVDPVDDNPINSIQDNTVSTNEDTSYTFNSGNGSLISVSDIDNTHARVTLSVSNGALTLSQTTGLTFVAGDGTSDGTMTFYGTKADVNAALDGLVYAPTGNYNGADTLTVTTYGSDDGSQAGVADTDTVTITVNAVNDAPVNTVPGAQSTNEDTNLTFSNGNGNLISIADVDATNQTVTISVSHGTLTLSQTTGLSFSAGDGTTDATMTFSGSIANINAALAGLVYTPTGNYNGADTLQIVTNDGTTTDTDTVAITVNAVNDAPTVNLGIDDFTVNEDGEYFFGEGTLGGGSIFADAELQLADTVRVTLSVSHGAISISNTTGATVVAGALGSNTVTLEGTFADLDALLFIDQNVTYTPDANYTGADTLTVTLSDMGNSGAGGTLTGSDTVAITVSAVDDAPVNSIQDSTVSTNEDTSYTFNSGNGSLISVSDIDNTHARVTLSVSNGALTLSQTTGLTFVAGDGTADGTMTFYGTKADVNAALDGLVYAPTGNYNGADTLTVTTYGSDDGSQAGVADTDTVTITVNAVNDAPTITLQDNTVSTNEDTNLTFSNGNSNLISIADVDGDSQTVTISVANGTLTLSQTTGLSFDTGDGTGDATMTFSGSVANINAALAGLVYTPTANYNGADTLTIETDDGTTTDTDTVAITVNAVNDAPTVSGTPSNTTTAEDTNKALDLRTVSFSDVDDSGGDVTATVSVTNGTLTFSGSTAAYGLTSFSGSGTNTITIVATRAEINTFLAAQGNTFTYVPTADFNGTSTVTMALNDGTDTGSSSFDITVTAKAGVSGVQYTTNINEDTPKTFSTGNGNAIQATDIGTGYARVTLNASQGTVTLSQLTGLTFTSGDGTSDGSMTFWGTTANVNAALDGLVFTPTNNFQGVGSLQAVVFEAGNDGTATGSSSSGTVTINVDAQPVNQVPGAQTINEDATLTFSSGNGNQIRVNDVQTGYAYVTLSAADGAITLAQTTGLTFIAGDGASDGTMTFWGTTTNVTNALNGLVYAPTANFNGATTLTITSYESLSDGTTKGVSDSDTVNITVNSVNDAPVNTVPGAQSTNEDTNLTFSNGNGNLISIADAEGGSQTVTIGVGNGVLTLSQTTGLTFSAGDGTADGTMTFSGSIADINAALAGLTYTPSANYNGADTLTIVTNDGTTTDTDNITITVNAVNDAPVLADIPANDSTNEDTNLAVDFTAMDITDIDTNGDVTLTIAVTNGTYTFAGDSVSYGLTSFNGSGTNTITVVGTVAEINSFLAAEGDQFTFMPTSNFNGTAVTTVTINDGSLTDSDTFDITVGAVDDAPVNSIQDSTVSTNEDTSYTFNSGNGSLISIADADNTHARVTLSVSNGALTLSQTTGLTFVAGDGTADGTMTFYGTKADVNAALDGLVYAPTGNYNGADTLTVTTYGSDDGSQAGVADTDTVTITVNAVNDAPTITLQDNTVSTNEDTNLTFSNGNSNLISIADVDGDSQTVTISVANGTLTLSQTTGLTFSAGDGTADGTMTFSGSVANINAALAGLVYTPTANYNGADTLTIETDDGTTTDTDTVAITVNAVNDNINLTNNGGTVNEDATLTLTNGMLLTTDVEDAAGDITYTVTALPTQGTLKINGVAAQVNDTFTQTDIANGLITYEPTGNYNGADSFDFDVADTDGSSQTNQTFAITVSSINDAPVNTVPGAQTTNEDTNITFSVGNSNLISIADVDATNQTVTISVSHGALTLSQTTGLNFTAGDGTGDATMTFSGSIANINAALAGLVYTPTANYNGADTLQIVTNDGTTTDTDTVAITVNSVNDAPTITLQDNTVSTNEDTNLTFSNGNSNLISIADVDGGSQTVTISVANGTLTLSQTTGLTFSAGDGTADGTMTFSGSVANINAALAGLVYTPTANYNGADTLTIETDDGTTTDTDTVAITVNSVNDVISLTNNGGSVTSNSTLTLDGTMLLTTDVEDGAANITYTVTALPTNGTLKINGVAAQVNDTFTQTDIANGLITFEPDNNYTGTDNFHFDVADQDGSSQTNQTFTITVGFTNVAPTFTAFPSDTTVNAGEAFNYTITTADANNDTRTITALSSLPSWLRLVDNGNGTATLSGTPNAMASAASYSLQFRVEDSHGATATQSFTLAIKAQTQVNIIQDTAPVSSDNHKTDSRNDNSVTDHSESRVINRFSIFTDQIKKAVTFISDAIYNPGKVDNIYAERQIIPEDNGEGLKAMLQDKFDIAQPDRQGLSDTAKQTNGTLDSVQLKDEGVVNPPADKASFGGDLDRILSDMPEAAPDFSETIIEDLEGVDLTKEPDAYQTLEEQIELQSSRFDDRKAELMKAAMDQ